ncbi:MAG: polyribonucleotide nucleotidyltransferase [Roseiflexus sp.]|jgi:polyribonucleotide nucleotidyltransferase|uniref:polyribonucleotide nucleotidyltransferase n=1 Tax=Roseiflexus sp. TaxID=2562120 RepID=UPI0025F6A089|nr:polyribonucleotide nucleotidyltransferase [Roseiflexus sp.]MCL6540480.1 polyribonucleotide nucleotidyltransferase [Roseiflexus sp.]
MSERQIHSVSMEIAGRTLTLEAGRFAEQANGAVVVRYGDTMLLATAVASKEPRADADFFPLTVDYEEKMYAAGKIPGSFFKREGKPTDSAILTARLTDRPLRPLFPEGYRNEVQIIVTTFSIDMVNDPAPLAIIGASAALAISDIPFLGPVGAVQVGYIDGKVQINPEMPDMPNSDLDLVVAGTKDAVLMVEAGAKELPEDLMLEAIIQGHQVCKQICDLQNELVRLAGRPKREFVPPPVDTSLEESIQQWLGNRLYEAITDPNKMVRDAQTEALKQEVIAHFTADEPEEELEARIAAVSTAFENLLYEEVRRMILERGERVDGRGPKDIRPISIEVGLIPRVHGSGLFTRGQTQVLTLATLGSPAEEQRLDDLGIETTKRYIHHYNFPPFSTGEVRRLGSPRRRDIGHGALAERSLLAVLPSKEEFPYTMRLVSETLSSNGSSSMASVCGSSLALMDAGVPIKAPVAGVAMGLITGKDGRWRVLTDIQGIEDHLGDMDFKVAGTAKGVTGLQLDIKTTGITYEIMREAFAQAREGRLYILDKMNAVISEPRKELSPYAPRIITLQINPDKIGALIGPGGKTVRGITEATGAQIDIEEDGRVYISTPDAAAAQQAVAMVEALTREIKVGDIFLGKVVRIMPFGAFVNLAPGKDGMVHVSELDVGRVENVEDVIKMGDEINVMVIGIEPGTGKVSLSRRALLTGETAEDRRNAGAGRGLRDGGGRSGGDRGPRGDDRQRPRRR